MALANVTITASDLVVEPIGLNKLWGFRSEVRVPLAHVVSASVGEASQKRKKGIRAPGLRWMNRWVGQFRKDGAWTYWCAATGPTLEIEIESEHFAHLVLTVDDPDASADEINRHRS